MSLGRFSLCCAAKIVIKKRRGDTMLVCNACGTCVGDSKKVLRGNWRNPHTG